MVRFTQFNELSDNYNGYPQTDILRNLPEGDKERREKLKIRVLPLSEWYIVRIWTGRDVETGEPEEAEDVEEVAE